ncbi:hypothetical protein [Parazoarcus communis]|jgi:hypothetical protein|uniref:Uncharacterized protein n=1 Tax=Parazoarcus communis SWub3 = DSM 12120 TaxID=1121029 RepID=A0A323V3E1_9RHOO|nr:hypothetical protein [Parazoarcus communis]NMG68832.1 hypothetical protein [Parazoarcus communis SWub3 = DSM 12120]PZA17946.1 hypothetical protein DNK49_05370 [Azoarcus communis] [Parazoarcus communis SWub3 = DSM 12120]
MNETLEIDLDQLTASHTRTKANNPPLEPPAELELTATQRIVLRCGKSSLTLYPNGKIVLRGQYILSEADDVNRIAGGRIELN